MQVALTPPPNLKVTSIGFPASVYSGECFHSSINVKELFIYEEIIIRDNKTFGMVTFIKQGGSFSNVAVVQRGPMYT